MKEQQACVRGWAKAVGEVRPAPLVRMAAALMVASAIWAGQPARAGTIAYQSPAPLAGNQNFSGPIGMDFDVVCTPIQITRLGAFDASQDGMHRPISVYVYDRDTQTAVIGPVVFAPGDDGVLVGGSRFKDLPAPVVLSGGFHGCIVAENYGAEEMLRNAFAPAVFSTLDTGGGLIQFVGAGRYEYPVVMGVFPTTVDVGPVNRYHAGTFEFEPAPGPVITAPPLSHTVPEGRDTSFTVTATGVEPLSYQWQFNGVDLPGEADVTLNRLNCTATDSGTYRVKVTDAMGALTCVEATLVVASPNPVLAFDASTITSAASDANGYAPGLANYFDVLPGTSVQVTDLGTVLFQSPLVNQVTVQLFSVPTATVLATVTFDATDTSTPLPSSPTLNLYLKPLGSPLWLPPGSYAVALYGSSAGAQYTRNPIGITVNGAIQVIGSRYASVGGVGVLPEAPDGTGFSYLAATLQMIVSGAPLITQQPQGGPYAPGATVTLRVTAAGSQPITYQWYQDNVAIPGAIGPELTLDNIGSLQGGDYTVQVQNDINTMTSAAATISVAGAPTAAIELHAAVVITGTPTLHYRVDYRTSVDPPDQWQVLQDIPSLPVSPYTVYDPTPATQPQRFYRVALLP